MKPIELYNREPERVHNDVNDLLGGFSSNHHIPEISEFYGWIDYEKIENPRVEIRDVKYFNFDGRRFWKLATVWFNGKPVMITRNAGREGDDHTSRFVTDEPLYKEMVLYIQTLIPVDIDEVKNVVDPNEDIKDLESFYGNTLDGYFERY